MSRILLVDDNLDLLDAMQIPLERAGHHALVAANGQDALALIRGNRIDLVITDIYMPEKEGLETILELRQLFPEVKIIAMSGGGQTQGRSNLFMAEQFGAAMTLKKPFSATELVMAVRTVLGTEPGRTGPPTAGADTEA